MTRPLLRDLLATMSFEQGLAFLDARDSLKRADACLDIYVDMLDAGKFSPEAARFTARRLERLAAKVAAVADALGSISNAA